MDIERNRFLFKLIEEITPIFQDKYKLVERHYKMEFPNSDCNYKLQKKKTCLLADARKPTGDSTIQPEVRRAK